MPITERLDALRSAPKVWRVVTRYSDGSEMVREMPLEAMARNWEIGERRKMGRELIERATGIKRRIESVMVEKL